MTASHPTLGVRARVGIQHRSGFRSDDDQSAVVIVTIRDPEGGPVYDGVVAAMRSSGWITSDLMVQNRARVVGSR